MLRSVPVAFLRAAVVLSGLNGVAQETAGPITLDDLPVDRAPPARPTAAPESSGPEAPKPQAERPSGIYVRPSVGSKDSELDKAWTVYELAVKTATDGLRTKMNEKYLAARAAAKIDDVTRYKQLLDELDTKGKLPTDEKSLATAVTATRKAYEDAAGDLQQAYKAVVERLLKDTSVDASVAKAVDEERLQLSTPAKIPRDAIKIGKHSYYLFLDPLTQAQAAAECKRRGGYLARITEPKEFAVFHKKLLLLPRDTHVWIDGTDAANEGTWTTLDGDPLPLQLPWLPGEPTNGRRWAGREQHGLSLQVKESGGTWTTGMDDLEQTERAGFICEWE